MRRTLLVLLALVGGSPAWSAPSWNPTKTIPATAYIEEARRLIGQQVKVLECNLSGFGARFGYCDVYRGRQSSAAVWSIRIDNATLAKTDLLKATRLCAHPGRSEPCWVNVLGKPALDGISDADLPMLQRASFEWVGDQPPPPRS